MTPLYKRTKPENKTEISQLENYSKRPNYNVLNYKKMLNYTRKLKL